MYCRNCGNEVNDKAIACPKCGVNPRTEKKYCPSCGTATTPNQVLCINCGVSLAGTSPFAFDASKLKDINLNLGSLENKKALIFPAVAFIGYFLTWVKYSMTMMGGEQSMSFSGSGLSSLLKQVPQIHTILSPALLYLFPLCLIGIIAADFMPQIAKYKKILSIAALVLVVYAAIGIFTMKIEMPHMQGALGEMQESITGKMEASFSGGFGLYVSLLATAVTVFFPGLLTKKQ